MTISAKQKKRVSEIVSELEGFQAEITAIMEEEQDFFDGKSEKWQEDEKGQECEQRISDLSGALDDVSSAATSLDGVGENE